jgi:CRP-like cAMP-binding protein
MINACGQRCRVSHRRNHIRSHGQFAELDARYWRISPIPVHSDIASRVSTTRETVARVLNDLARRGIVERTKQSLVIHDIAMLETLVEDVRG